MFDAWGDRPFKVDGVIRYFGGQCDNGGNCAFRGIFGDGAETFVAEWYISKRNVKRTVFTSSDDVVDLFRKNIDPSSYDD